MADLYESYWGDFYDGVSTAGRLSTDGTVIGTISLTQDQDWYRIYLTDGRNYQFTVTGDTLSDPTLSLHNSSGSLITSDDNSAEGLNSRITYHPGGSQGYGTGYYYLNVGGSDSSKGTYTLTAQDNVGDDFSDNSSTSGTLVAGETVSGHIRSRDDKDWFKINLTSGHKYAFSAPLDYGLSYELTLYDSSGNSLANASGGNTYISHTPSKNGTYFIEIKGKSQSQGYSSVYYDVGNYNLSATDLSAPSYTLSSSSLSLNEGQTLTSTVSTENVDQGTTLYWSVSGTNIDSSDFSSGALTGSGSVGSDGGFTFSHALASDETTEGTETLAVKLFSDSSRSNQVGSTQSVSIADTSTTPTASYSLSTSASSLNEGQTLTSTASTSGVAEGTTLYWSVSGTNIDSSDFSSGALTGSGAVNSDGDFTFSHTLANDLTTEGSETLQVKLFSDSNRTTQVGSTQSVSIADTSTTPTASYSLSTSASSLNEGQSLTTTVQTTNVSTWTSLYWTVSGTNINTSDFSSGGLSGIGTVGSNGSFSFSHTLDNDLTTEGNETFNIKLFKDSSHSQQVGNTASINISDTSLTPSTSYEISTSASSLNEGQTLSTTIKTSNVDWGTKLYWAISGTGIDSSDFSNGNLNGYGWVLNDGTFSFSHTLANDKKTEGNESMSLNLYTDSNYSQQVGSTATVTIIDTSTENSGVVNNSKDFGLISNNQVINYNGSVNNGSWYDHYFEINKTTYSWFKLTDFDDDLDINLYKYSSGEWEFVDGSDKYGSEDELFFEPLESGEYVLEVSPYGNLTNSSQSYSLQIDNKTFLENSLLPNDPRFKDQWHLFNTGQAGGTDDRDIFAPEAWKIRNDASNVVVAVIDTGIDYNHIDLDDNIWINPNEIKGNNIDDDNNGYVDDIYGWDFNGNDNNPHPILNSNIHGTHVAGIVGAEGNNAVGVTGVCWDVRIMNLKVFSNYATGAYTSYILDSIRYAADNGADVINLSLGAGVGSWMKDNGYYDGTFEGYKNTFPDHYQKYYNALKYASDKGVTIIAAAGNDYSSNNIYTCIPADFSNEIPGMISVASLSNKGEKAFYSNYGSSITIAAPGGDYSVNSSSSSSSILSTVPSNKYKAISGTSMAAPVVAGAAALIIAEDPNLSPEEVKNKLIENAYKAKWLEGVVEEGRMLDLHSSLNATRSIRYPFNDSTTASDIASKWVSNLSSINAQSVDVLDNRLLSIETSTWGENVKINRVVRASSSGGEIVQAKQITFNQPVKSGSVIEGGGGVDTVRGLAGWDVLDGSGNDDLVHGGNGRDIISGGAGADELHGDFGWNTYRSEKDAYKDLIVIKSDQYLSNWIYGKAGNNPNGEKVDIIEGLDATDEIKIVGVITADLSFGEATAKGVSGVGIYAKGALEGLYTGGDLTTAQIQTMTHGTLTTQWDYRGGVTKSPDLLA